MDSINYFQTSEDFFILHTKLDEDKKNIIEQADVVIYSDFYFIALNYIEYKSFSPIIIYKSKNLKSDLNYAEAKGIKTIKNIKIANSLFFKGVEGEEILPEFYCDVAKIYIDLKLYQKKTKAERDFITGMRLYYGSCNEVQDYFLAIKYFRKAAYFNHSDAQFQIGYCYLIGNGVRRSWKISQKWFIKSAQNGNRKAQLYLSKEEAKNENNR